MKTKVNATPRKSKNITADREKLKQLIMNLTDEEAEAFISFLKAFPTLESAAPLCQSNFAPEQTISA